MPLKLTQERITVTSSGTAENLASNETLVQGFFVVADPGNTDCLFIGGAPLASTKLGIPLTPGSHLDLSSIDYDATNEYIDISQIKVDAASSNDVAIVCKLVKETP